MKTIRLRVAYKTAAEALREITRNVQRGMVTLEAQRPVERGARFVFELTGNGVSPPAELYGEVVDLQPSIHGGFLVTVKYGHGEHREGFEQLLRHVFEQQRSPDSVRKFPRLPLHVRAIEAAKPRTTYLVRDLSTGGLGVQVEGNALPPGIQVGAPFLLEIDLPSGLMPLHGEVSWVATSVEKDFNPQATVHPSFGVSFGKLRAQAKDTVKRLLLQRDLPPPPWNARVSFGMDAVARMP